MPAPDKPFFSIVLATYGRGAHIAPTIESALAQTFTDFELIVVGDGAGDDTAAAVRAFADIRITWRNLAANSGSQSFPNNEGIRNARGQWICYLGHDDVWSPDHLASLARAIEAGESDFAVSGCVYYGPRDSGYYFVTGLFATSDAAFHHFFPPTSFTHRRDVTDRVGAWRDPREISYPVDADFLLRAASAGMRFVSTGRITAHKFAAGHRYLSYLRQSSEEQRAMLDRLRAAPDMNFDDIVAASKRIGRYMTTGYTEFTSATSGSSFERNRQNKGIARPALRPLRERTVMTQTDEPRALDWYQREEGRRPHRWSGPNPRPKILIPFTGERARIAIEVIGTRPCVQHKEILLLVEGRSVRCSHKGIPGVGVNTIADIPLKADDHTVLTLETPMFYPHEHYQTGDSRYLGIAVADIVIKPI